MSSVSGQSPQDTVEIILEDPWFGYDKVQHFTFSFLWVLSCQYVTENKFDLTEEDAIPISVGSGVTLGLLKEIHDDRKRHNQFSIRDLIADGAGILCGVMIIKGLPAQGS
ncbi:MAG: hypothetical protein ACE5EE_04970 [Fidelibacterota bacterium]